MTAGIFAASARKGISFGNAFTITTANPANISLDALSATAAIVCFSDTDDGNDGKVIAVSNISGTPSSSSAVTFEDSGANNIDVTALSTTAAMVAYTDAADNKGKFCVLTSLGGTPSAGAVTEFEAGSTSGVSIASVSSTVAVVSYADVSDGNKGKFCVLTTSPSTSTPIDFDTDIVGSTACIKLDSTTVAIFYRQGTATTGIYARVITDVTTSPVIGSQVTIDAGNFADPEAAATSGAAAAVVYCLNAPPFTMLVSYVSDLTGSPSVDSTTTIGTTSDSRLFYGIASTSSDRATVAVRDASDSNKGNLAHLKSIDSTPVEVEAQFFNGTVSDVKIASLGTGAGLIIYDDAGDLKGVRVNGI